MEIAPLSESSVDSTDVLSTGAVEHREGNDVHPEPAESEEPIDISTADDVDIDEGNSDDDEGTASP